MKEISRLQVKRIDMSNLIDLDNIVFNKSSDKERLKIKKYVKNLNNFLISEYKYGGGSTFIELFFVEKRLLKLNKLLEKYNTCISICLLKK